MTQPLTNAQVALQCAVDSFAQDRYLRWLNANTLPAADQPGELA